MQQQETHLVDAGAGWWKQGANGADYLSFKVSQTLQQGDYILAITNQYKKEPHQPDMLLRLRVDGPAPPQQGQQQHRPQTRTTPPQHRAAPPQRTPQQRPHQGLPPARGGYRPQPTPRGYPPPDPYPEDVHTDDDIPF